VTASSSAPRRRGCFAIFAHPRNSPWWDGAAESLSIIRAVMILPDRALSRTARAETSNSVTAFPRARLLMMVVGTAG
jgi:hypothetical protein